MLFGSKKIVGLDIGTSTIKLVEVQASKKNISLSTFGYVPTPAGAVQAGEIINPDAVSSAIADLVQQTKVKTKKAAVAVSGTSVITKKISIPRIEENLLPEQLKWEAEQYIPFDVNEINLGYSLIKGSHGASEQMSLLLVAAKREPVMRLAEVVEAAGLNCVVVDVGGFALANTYLATHPESQHTSVGLLCMGASQTHFVILEHGEVTFCRDLSVGGATFTSDIQKTLGITPSEAESLKISAGSGQPVPQEVSDVCQQTAETVADEIRRSYDFYLATAGDVQIQKFYVTGGGFSFKGLKDTVQNALGVNVEVFNPFQKVKFDEKNFSYEFISQVSPFVSLGMGLSLRSLG